MPALWPDAKAHDPPAVEARRGGGGGAYLLWRTERFEVVPRLLDLLRDRGGRAYSAHILLVARCLVLYRTLGEDNGQQWGPRQRLFDRLYQEFGVRNEAAASATNSRLRGRRNARWFSGFPAVDVPLGAHGDFLATPAADLAHLGGNWWQNPPFIERLAARMVLHLLEVVRIAADRRAAAARTVASLFPAGDLFGPASVPPDPRPRPGTSDCEDRPGDTAFVYVPRWTDADFYAALRGSPLLAAQHEFSRGQHECERPDGSTLVANFDCSLFALCASPATFDRTTFAHICRGELHVNPR
jgi:hypothetical protein